MEFSDVLVSLSLVSCFGSLPPGRKQWDLGSNSQRIERSCLSSGLRQGLLLRSVLKSPMRLKRLERGESFKNREILSESNVHRKSALSVINARFARKECQRNCEFFRPCIRTDLLGKVKLGRGQSKSHAEGEGADSRDKNPRKKPWMSKLQRTVLSNPAQVIRVRATH